MGFDWTWIYAHPWQAAVIFALSALAGALVLLGDRISARLCGWSRLARQFPATGEISGHVYRRRTASIGSCRFLFRMTFGIGDRGLFLVPVLSTRSFPPLLIPGRDIRYEQVWGWPTNNCEIWFPACPGIVIKFDIGLLRLMQPFLSTETVTDSPIRS